MCSITMEPENKKSIAVFAVTSAASTRADNARGQCVKEARHPKFRAEAHPKCSRRLPLTW